MYVKHIVKLKNEWVVKNPIDLYATCYAQDFKLYYPERFLPIINIHSIQRKVCASWIDISIDPVDVLDLIDICYLYRNHSTRLSYASCVLLIKDMQNNIFTTTINIPLDKITEWFK